MSEVNIYEKLLELSPLPEPEDPNRDDIFKDDEKETPTPQGTSNEELLAKISALEKMLADMINKEDGTNI